MAHISEFSLFSNTTSPIMIYILSLHDALPILEYLYKQNLVDINKNGRFIVKDSNRWREFRVFVAYNHIPHTQNSLDRKSTRLNSSHVSISYDVFCLKKKEISPL